MTKHFLIMAVRTLLRNKVYSLINIAGLAISMTCFIFILLWANDELNYNRNHKNIDNIYCAMLKDTKSSKIVSYYFDSTQLTLLKKEFPEIKEVSNVRVTNDYLPFFNKRGKFNIAIRYVDSTYNNIFTWDFIEGNPKTALQKDKSLVITEKAALKYFGTVHCLGQQIYYPFINNYPFVFTVTGVIKDIPKNSSINAEFFSKLTSGDTQQMFYVGILLQSKDINPKFLEQKSKVFSEKYTNKYGYQLFLYPYKDLYLNNPMVDEKPMNKVKLFLGMAILILIIACINFINLTTASYLQRTKEIGIRQMLGSNRWQLIQRFMSEAFVVSGIAIILSMVLFVLLLPYFNQFTEKEVQIRTLNLSFWLELVLVFFLMVCISGFYPALYLSRLKPNLVQKTSFSKSNKAAFRKSLIVFQFVISISLIISTLLIYRQIELMKNKELGFDKTNLCYFDMQVGSGVNKMKKELQKSPIISSVSNGVLPHKNNIQCFVSWAGKKDVFTAIQGFIDCDYPQTIGLQIIEGRFSRKEFLQTLDVFEVVVNETFAKKMDLSTSVIGSKIKICDYDCCIVGVVKNFQHRSLKEPIQPFLLQPNPRGTLLVRYQEGTFTQAKKYIYQTLERLHMNEKPDIILVDDLLKQQYKSEESQFQLFSLFSGLAILISCLGMIGLSLFETNRRTKEIGVRRVNGASFLQMIVLLNRSFLKWVGIAFIVACPISYYVMNRWLQDFAYRTSLSWWIFALSGLIALVIGLVSTSYQTLRAAKRNPIESLRYE